jgi:O-methyltransferase
VAARLGLDPVLTYRLMRALGSLDFLQENASHHFTLTAVGKLLRRDHPATVRGMVLLAEGPTHYALWKHLPAMVRDGRQNAFLREFGQTAFEYAALDAEYGATFNEGMSSYSVTQTGWLLDALTGYEFSKIDHLCDVGGGHGHMLCSLLARYRHLTGTVLDLPSVFEDRSRLWAEKMNVADRCRFVGGDMFKNVPPADAYMMKMILHDWNDEECLQILHNIHRSAAPGGRIFIVEHVIPDPETPHFSKLFDIHMMCWGTGRERTVQEYSTLLEGAGWRYVKTWYPTGRMMGAVEGVKP